jgi:O-antigen/teichoic acid export membrane protein
MHPRAALVWSFAERYASFAIGLASTMLLARLLTPAQVGVFSLCMALLAVLGIVRDFGVSEYIIQEPELTPERLATACGIALAVAWPLAALLYVSRNTIAGFFDEPMVATILAVLCIQLVLLPISSPVYALLNRQLAFRRIFVLQLACNALQAGVTVWLAWRGYGSLALAWGPVVNIGVQTLLLLLWPDTRALFITPRLHGAARVWAFGLPYAGSRGLETLARNMHEPVIARQFDFASVGLFSRAWGMVEMFHTHVADAVVRVATPAFAQARRDQQDIGAAFARALSLYVALAWPFFAFVAIAAPELVLILFGGQWTAAAPLASVLALAALPAALYELVPQLLSATGHVQRRLRITLLAAPLHIAAIVVASNHSLLAVAAVSFLTSVWTLWLSVRQLESAVGVGWRRIVEATLPSALLAAATAAAMVGAALGLRSLAAGPAGVLLVVLASGMFAWGLVARLLQHPAYDEAAAWVAGARQRLAGSSVAKQP